jgi:hypothetical protein
MCYSVLPTGRCFGRKPQLFKRTKYLYWFSLIFNPIVLQTAINAVLPILQKHPSLYGINNQVINIGKSKKKSKMRRWILMASLFQNMVKPEPVSPGRDKRDYQIS